MQIICTVDIRTRELSLEDVTIAAFDHLVDDILFDVEPIDGFELETSTIKIAAVGPLGEPHDYEIDPSTVTVDEETGNINFVWSIPVGVTAMPLSSFKINDVKKITFAVCAEIVSGDNLVKAWHSNDGTIKVKAHLEPESGGGEDPSEEATNAQKIGQLQTATAILQRKISGIASGTPPTADSTSEMDPDESTVYINTTDGNWYYWDGSDWTSGGVYGGATTSTTFNQHGVPADDFAVGEALAEKVDSADVGDLSQLTTTAKDNLVSAINEANDAVTEINESLDEQETAVSGLSAHTVEKTIENAGNVWVKYLVTAGHDYYVENNSDSAGVLQAFTTNTKGYTDIERMTPYNLPAGNAVVFRASQNAKYVRAYSNGMATFVIKDLTTLNTMFSSVGNTENYNKYVIGNDDLTPGITWTYGKYISDDGTLTNFESGRYSNLIPASMGIYTLVVKAKVTNLIPRVHAYNANGEWVQQVFKTTLETAGTYILEINATGNFSYLRLSLTWEKNIELLAFTSGKIVNSRIEDLFSNKIVREVTEAGNIWISFEFKPNHVYRITNTSSANTGLTAHTTNGVSWTYIEDINNGAVLNKGKSALFLATKSASTLHVYTNGAGSFELTELTTIESVYKKSDEIEQDLHAVNRAYDNNVRSVNRIAYGFPAPMQSIEGYKLAYKAGYRNMLCDIRFTYDNVPVCFHDSYFNQTYRMVQDNSGQFISTSTPVYISNVSSSDLGNYDVGNYKGAQFKGTRILTFERMLTFCKCLGVNVYLEMKVTPTSEQFGILFGLIDRYGMREHTVWAPQTIEQLNTLTAYEANVYIQFHTNTGGTYTDMPDTFVDAIIGKVNSYNRGRVTMILPSSVGMTDAQLNRLINSGIGICTGGVSGDSMTEEEYLTAYWSKDNAHKAFVESLTNALIVGKYMYEHSDEFLT